MVLFKVEGIELIRKTVKESGTGAVVYCPRKWLGKRVILILEGQEGDGLGSGRGSRGERIARIGGVE